MNRLEPAPALTSIHWMTLATSITESFQATESERHRFLESKTARLIAALPFLAACEQPSRTALAHLASYWLTSRGSARWAFHHSPSDDAEVTRKIAVLGAFQGGEPVVLERGMNLLSIVMLRTTERDAEADGLAGRYNPVAVGVWNSQAMIEALISDIEASPCPAMDGMMSVDDAQRTWWS